MTKKWCDFCNESKASFISQFGDLLSVSISYVSVDKPLQLDVLGSGPCLETFA